MGDVKDLDQERKKKEKRDRKEATRNDEKVPQSELFFEVVNKMNRAQFSATAWPDFARRFHLLQDQVGCKAVLEELADKVVAYRIDNVIVESIVRYCWEELSRVPGAEISYGAAKSCKDLWWSLTPALSEAPVALAEKSYEGYSFRKLPFDAAVERNDAGELVWPEAPPHFASFLSRCSNARALCAFLGSLFYPDADRQQYVYLFGEGQDGKGSLLRMLYHLLGDASQALQPKGRDDRFWNMKVYGKRLVMFTDCEDFRFFSSPEFKSLTGNDAVYFEEKGKMGFTAIPTCKFIVASNQKPNISSQKSDIRRLIYVEVKGVPDAEIVSHFDQLLLAEAEGIVRLCKTVYESNCAGHGPIPCDEATGVADEAEEMAMAIFYRHFAPAPPECWVEGQVLLGILRAENLSTRDIRKVIQVWERQAGIVKKKTAKGFHYMAMKCSTRRSDADRNAY